MLAPVRTPHITQMPMLIPDSQARTALRPASADTLDPSNLFIPSALAYHVHVLRKPQV